MKRFAICLVIIVSLVWAISAFAEDIEKQELRLQVLQTEIAALRTAIQRDNAQIGLLQERIQRINREVEDRLAQANKLKGDIEKSKDAENAKKEKAEPKKK